MTAGRLMAGCRVLLRKELLESWRTLRLPVVAGLFLFVGLSSPLLARYLPEILKAAGGDQLSGLQLPPPTAADAVAQLWKNLAQFGAFAAIILAMGSVAAETDRGTAAFVLSKTVVARRVPRREGRWPSRPSWRSRVILAVVGGWIYTAILFEPLPVAGWLGLGVLAWLGLAALAAITFLGSTVTGSVAAAAGIGFIGWLGLSIVAAMPNVGRFTPAGLADPAVTVATGAPGRCRATSWSRWSRRGPHGAALALAAWSFRRQEL